MPPDKFTALWVSHSSISDFLECERAYFLKHVYRDPESNRKMKIISPPLALGQAVHEVIESLSVIPLEKRFSEPLMEKFNTAWKNVAGKRGGFLDPESEETYKKRGREMIERVMKHPGPIARKAVKIKQELPHYWLSEEEGIILCGKIDWLEYLPEKNSVQIIDFKTGNNEEKESSLQLPIYLLLVTNCQQFNVHGVSYWYLARSTDLTTANLPDKQKSHNQVIEVARKIKVARKLGKFKCSQGGCRACKPYERVLAGEGEWVYVDNYNTDVYILDISTTGKQNQAVIL